jgi:large subunit ribosomal protein L29
MKASEVHAMSDSELRQEAQRIRKRIYERRVQAVTEKLENPREIRNLRRDLARVLTEQRQRALGKRSAA